MDAIQQTQKVIQRYRWTLCVSLLVSYLLSVLGAIGLDELGTPDLFQAFMMFGLITPFLLLAIWFIVLTKKRDKHFGWCMQLCTSELDTFIENMGLISVHDKPASALTNTLQNRVMQPWVSKLKHVFRIGQWIMSMLICIQLIILTVLGLTLFTESNANQSVNVIQKQLPATASNDTQQTTSAMDQLAHDLLHLRDQLDAFTEQQSDEVLQQIISQLNETWQGINVRLAAMSESDQSQFGQLESARSLPITQSQSIKSADARKTLRDALTKDINTLASQGARFDGYGMISQGESNVPDTSAAKGAQGRYDELLDRGNSSTGPPVDRRMQQVPPSLRNAVARYLTGQTDTQIKAHKGVEP